jgi:hypothetical protein
LYPNTTGNNNSAFGRYALSSNTTGSFNTSFGVESLNLNTTGSYNTCIGYQAGYSLNGSGNTLNTFVGQSAGYNITTGTKNTIIGTYNGNQGGLNITTASNRIVLSDGDGNPQADCDGSGYWTFRTQGATGPAWGGNVSSTNYFAFGSYAMIVGGSNVYFTCKNTSGGVYLNGASATSWTAVSDETRKVIIEPITDAANKIATLRTVIGRLKTDTEDVRRPYLIAQDVQAVLPEAVSESEDKEGAVLGLSYTEVIPLLVAAIKELKSDLDATKAELAELKGQA